jgi:hypothetical protein
LESKPYRDIEQSIGAELSRVERNTKNHRGRLEELRRELRDRIERKYSFENSQIEIGERGLTSEEDAFSKYIKEMDRRYHSKKNELEQQEGSRISGDPNNSEKLKRRRREIVFRGERIRNTKERIRGEIVAADAGSRSYRKELGTLPNRFAKLRDEAIRRFEHNKGKEIESIESLEGDERKLPEYFISEEKAIEAEFERLRRQSDQVIKSRDSSGTSELSQRIKKLLETRKLLDDYQNAQHAYKRSRKAWECLNSGTYKDWV